MYAHLNEGFRQGYHLGLQVGDMQVLKLKPLTRTLQEVNGILSCDCHMTNIITSHGCHMPVKWFFIILIIEHSLDV